MGMARVAVFSLVVWSLLSSHAFGGAYNRCKVGFGLMSGRTPEQFFAEKHWTLVDTRSLFGKGNKPDPELVEALSKGYDGIFERAKAEAIKAGVKPSAVAPGRFGINGLKSAPSNDDSHRVSGLSPEVLAKIDAWANEVLRVARAATGEDLEIRSVALGKGFVAGGVDPLVHVDNAGTYIHGLTTLQGPSTLLFPNDRKAAQHYITEENPETGQLTLRQIMDREGKNPVRSTDAIQAANGQTAIITGSDYVKGPEGKEKIPGRESTVHSSPFRPGMDRITLFIDLQPKKK